VQIARWVKETLEKNDNILEKMISIYLTGGKGIYMLQSEKPTIIIIVDDRKHQPSSDYENGIKVKAVQYLRPYPTVKTNFYIEGIKQLAKVKGQGITEIVYYDDSQVYEGAGSNIFAVINSRLTTTKSNILEGVTRNSILRTIQLDIPIEIRDFTFDELLTASEVFLTGSNSEVRGVVEINGHAVGDGKVGIITKEVLRQYKEYLDAEAV
jgi:branched-chain amino acid aminotransferase